ncbi:MAG: hypothetical protein LBP92_05395 [Deltaproteobacteria bacterium]|jgi:hypothetical protein|nr:hypothetical protein [Deltaproteobacteria bacterium]
MCQSSEVAGLRQEIERLKRENAELRLKIPTGVLRVCSECKKVMDPQGRWLPLDRYLALYAGLDCSHGYCDECVARLLEEAGP